MKKSVKYSKAVADRVLALIESGHCNCEIGEMEGMPTARSISNWALKQDYFKDKYEDANYFRWYSRLETSLLRVADSSRDFGRQASATVHRDMNLMKATQAVAGLTCPRLRDKAKDVEIGVTVKRIVIVEKFDGAKIKRFATDN